MVDPVDLDDQASTQAQYHVQVVAPTRAATEHLCAWARARPRSPALASEARAHRASCTPPQQVEDHGVHQQQSSLGRRDPQQHLDAQAPRRSSVPAGPPSSGVRRLLVRDRAHSAARTAATSFRVRGTTSTRQTSPRVTIVLRLTNVIAPRCPTTRAPRGTDDPDLRRLVVAQPAGQERGLAHPAGPAVRPRRQPPSSVPPGSAARGAPRSTANRCDASERRELVREPRHASVPRA